MVLLFDNAANCIPNDTIKFHLISLVGKSSKCREMDIVIEEYLEANTILLFFLANINDWLLCCTIAGISDAAAMEMRFSSG